MLSLIAAVALMPVQSDFPMHALGIGTVTTVEGTPLKISMPGKKATVLFFITTDCPIANRYAPEIARIAKEFAPKGIGFVRVYPEKVLSKSDVIKHGKEYGISSLPAVIDSKHYVVNKVMPKVTPEAALIAANGRLLYRGRIDGAYMDHGRFTETPERLDLREALKDVLAGRPVRLKNVPAVGCDIPDIN
jgi:thiol-disulfide isomerase/thioredoxin